MSLQCLEQPTFCTPAVEVGSASCLPLVQPILCPQGHEHFGAFFFLFLKSPRVWTKTKTIYTILCKHKNTQVISLNYSSLKPAYSAGHASKGLQQQLGSCKAQEHISECSWNPLYTPAKQPGELHTEKILSRDSTSQGNSKDVQVLTCKNSLTPTNLGWLCAD